MGSGASKSQLSYRSNNIRNDDQSGDEPNRISTNSALDKKNSPNDTFSESYSKFASSLPSVVVSAKKLAEAKRRENADARKKILNEYPELEDALNSVQEWIQEIKNNKESEIKEKNMKLETRRKLEEIYGLYFEWDEMEHKKILGDQLAQLHAGQILTEYYKALTLEGTDTPTEGYKAECLEILRGVCWNFTDGSLNFCLELGRTGMFPYLVADLKTFHRESDKHNIRSGIILSCISILHNCAKATDNKKYFKQANTVEAILPYSKTEYQDVKMITMMTLAYIIEEKDNALISTDDSMIKFILQYLKVAIKALDHKCDGFSAEEIVAGLMHLANNEENKIKIVNEGVLSLLVELLQKGSNSEKAVSAKTVWILSFSDQNKSKIREEKNMLEVLKELSEVPGDASKSANGALWVLGNAERLEQVRSTLTPMKTSSNTSFGKKLKIEDKSMSKKSGGTRKSSTQDELEEIEEENEIEEESLIHHFSNSENEEEEEEEEEEEDELEKMETLVTKAESGNSSTLKHIMISYQWNCQKLIMRVKERLEKMNYRVWIDVESMGGSTLQAMAEAVENSEVVLVCMSHKYKESPNCRTEAEYAYKLDKTMVPLRVEQAYEPDGWLGALQGAKFYFDFSNLMSFDSVFPKLVKELGERGKFNLDAVDGPLHPIKSIPVYAPPLPTIRIPVKNWTKDDVVEWATLYKISSRKIQQLDGESLAFLSSLRNSAPEFFYKYISEKLSVVELRDMKTLCNGLNNLDL